ADLLNDVPLGAVPDQGKLPVGHAQPARQPSERSAGRPRPAGGRGRGVQLAQGGPERGYAGREPAQDQEHAKAPAGPREDDDDDRRSHRGATPVGSATAGSDDRAGSRTAAGARNRRRGGGRVSRRTQASRPTSSTVAAKRTSCPTSSP